MLHARCPSHNMCSADNVAQYRHCNVECHIEIRVTQLWGTASTVVLAQSSSICLLLYLSVFLAAADLSVLVVVVSTSAVDCMESLVCEVTYCQSNGA